MCTTMPQSPQLFEALQPTLRTTMAGHCLHAHHTLQAMPTVMRRNTSTRFTHSCRARVGMRGSSLIPVCDQRIETKAELYDSVLVQYRRLTEFSQVAMESSPRSKMRGAIGVMSKEPALESDLPLTLAIRWLMHSSGLSPAARVMELRILALLVMTLTADIPMLFSRHLRLVHGSR